MNNSTSHQSVKLMLEKLSDLWHSRAAINNDQIKFNNLVFDAKKADFSEELLPFSEHQVWLEAPENKRSLCLSYAWILYNLKTIYIECDIVTPACEDIIKNPPLSDNRQLIQDVISQALLDEALHTRMSLLACNYIYQKRNLKYLNFTDFNLMR